MFAGQVWGGWPVVDNTASADTCTAAEFDGSGRIAVPTATDFDYDSLTVELWYQKTGGSEWIVGQGLSRDVGGYRISKHSGSVRYIKGATNLVKVPIFPV